MTLGLFLVLLTFNNNFIGEKEVNHDGKCIITSNEPSFVYIRGETILN